MRLQYYRRTVLHALGGGLAHDDIAYLVAFALQVVTTCEVDKPLYDLALLLRGARHGRDLVEYLPHSARVQISYSHNFGFKFFSYCERRRRHPVSATPCLSERITSTNILFLYVV